MIALAEYNKNPYDIDARKITFGDLYELFISDKFLDESLTDNEKNSRKAYRMAFNHSESLHKEKFIDIKKAHMQDVIDKCTKGHSTKKKIKLLFGQMYKFAMENDWVEKDYSQFVTVPENTDKSSREPFTSEEIDKLWNSQHENAGMALIMIYTGLRPGELIRIENENINLTQRYMRGGIKTKAGINRIIPLNKKIAPLIERRMSDSKYLILNSKGQQMKDSTFRKNWWNPLMYELNMNHRPHDARHTFASLMDNADANKLSIKKIMGHASQDITDKVYTHKDIDELIKAVDLI